MNLKTKKNIKKYLIVIYIPYKKKKKKKLVA